uniref:Cytochrome P450 monooxygenase nodJ n=1 Tax=Hypoxylon pulicicidum TaxID=1243767 RepID=NODJ_HYPPI|nr:RecName: Full=Cytochrome P450 monooxygenase nodJ; AltName: Full=Nodulisporic acid biosynthesis cluster protein J [Hypoxylon pulicicidum]AUM60053.1 cytochrome P450 oxygenase [Hypoxylon pulicicidum]
MELIVIIITLAFCILLYGTRWRAALDPREPRLISPTVPLIGHILGIATDGFGYFSKLNDKYGLPAFSLQMPLSRLYVITSSELVPAIQRQSQNIRFDTFEFTLAAERVGGVSGPGLKLLKGSIVDELQHAMHHALIGHGLDAMNLSMIEAIKPSIDELQSQKQAAFDLFAWCKRSITMASTDSVYGPMNPFRSIEVERAFWDFASNMNMIILNVLPFLTARKSLDDRRKVVDALTEYYNLGGHENSSEMTYGRWEVQYNKGITTQDIARMEIVNAIGVLSNTAPSTFWTLFEIYSRPSLLRDLRQELVASAVYTHPGTDGGIVRTIDLSAVRAKCSLLLGTFQEVLRMRSNAIVTRMVHEDTILNERVLFKKGSVIVIPARCVNREKSVWGETGDSFDAYRYLGQGKSGTSRSGRNVTRVAFQSFGTAPNICPGRHFASGEILAVVAMVILRFDMEPVLGEWIPPKANVKTLASSIQTPAGEFMVTLRERKEFKDDKWDFRVTEGDSKFPLLVG